MPSPNTLARRHAEPKLTVRVYHCAFCKRRGMPLKGIQGTPYYACQPCIKGCKDPAVAVMDLAKRMGIA